MAEITLPTGQGPAATASAGDAKGLPMALEPAADPQPAGAFELVLALRLGTPVEGIARPRGLGSAAAFADAPIDAAAADAAPVQIAPPHPGETGGDPVDERAELIAASSADPALALASLTAAMSLGHSAAIPAAPEEQAPPETVDAARPLLAHAEARRQAPAEVAGIRSPHGAGDTSKRGPGDRRDDAPLAVPVAAQAPSIEAGGEVRLHATGSDPSADRVQPPFARTEVALPVATSAAVADKAAAVQLATPVRAPEWRDEFAARVTYLVSDRVQAASLQVNPPELGPVEVRVRVANAEATLSFVAPHAQVREAIESALPRLRELLADAGIALGSCHVGADARGTRDHAAATTPHTAAGEPDMRAGPSAGEVRIPPTVRGLVDLFV